MLGAIHEFDVYAPAGDDYSKVNGDVPLKGRFTHNTINTYFQLLPLPRREEGVPDRRLQYPATFNMPDNARIHWLNDPTSTDVTVWNMLEGTESAWHGPGGAAVLNTCQLNRLHNID